MIYFKVVGKPKILFVALIKQDYSPYFASRYGLQCTFDLLPHKLSILALVAWLREHGCDGSYVWIDVENQEDISLVEETIRKESPHALGFSLVTDEFIGSYRIIEKLKAKYPEIPVIVGGPHVTALPIETLEKYPLIDYVVIGEGEQTLEELLKHIASGVENRKVEEIRGIAYRNNLGEITINPDRECIDNLDILPEPAFDLIFNPLVPPDERSAFPLVCSYGCYFHCTFCSVPHGHYRYLSPEKVVERIEKIQKKYKVEYFAIRDSFWPPKREWLDKFCDQIEKRGLKIRFHFQTRAGVLHQEDFARLKAIGAQAIGIGVEAGDPEILKSIKKGITIEMARKTIGMLNRVGIFSISFFIFGNKGENRETIEKSINLANELNSSIAFFHVLAPYPGSEAYESVPAHNKEWWVSGKLPSICDLSVEELGRIAEEAFIRYPLRWRYLRQHVLGGKLYGEFRKVTWRIYLLHLKRYLLGIAERYWLGRNVIKFAKQILRH